MSEFVKVLQLQATKRLSQHFLFDGNITNKFVIKSGLHAATVNNNTEAAVENTQAAMVENDNYKRKVIIEIGAGPGGLTTSLMELCDHRDIVIAVEKDKRFLTPLQEIKSRFSHKMTLNVELGDALVINEADLVRKYFNTININSNSNSNLNSKDNLQKNPSGNHDDEIETAVVGNLPYGIGTQLLFKWLKDCAYKRGIFSINQNTKLVLMLQKEVVDRIIAKPTSADYGRLSVMTQHLCHVKRLFTVSGKSYVPIAKVDGSVVELIPKNHDKMINKGSSSSSSNKDYFKSEKALINPGYATDVLEDVCRMIFSHRRKMISKVLTEQIGIDDPDKLGIDGRLRPQDLKIQDYCNIVDYVLEKGIKL